jgi:hypothetical protein
MVSERLKNIIFKQLYKELSKVEIIPYKDSVYFIDRENKYWYFEYEKSNMLWWRYDFFVNFFVIFSLELDDCKKVMGDWVEEVLNCKVNTTAKSGINFDPEVEDVLNCKVNTTKTSEYSPTEKVEEVLNCKVNTTVLYTNETSSTVEEVLNCKVIQPNQ